MTTTIETIKIKIRDLPQANLQSIFLDMLKLMETMGAELAARDLKDAAHMQEVIDRHSADPETQQGTLDDFEKMATDHQSLTEQVSKERQPGESELMFSKEEIESGQTITEQGPPELTSPIADAEGSGPEGQLPDEPTFPVYDSIDDIDEPLTEDVQDATDKGNTE